MHVTLYVDLAIAVIFSYQVSLNHFKWLPRYKSEINQAYGSGEITENEESKSCHSGMLHSAWTSSMIPASSLKYF